ncbi:MAG: NCS2 family permease [Planctomycetota bacterium]|jgi:AGZA family xanthine/uracil permease-like MFS transporter
MNADRNSGSLMPDQASRGFFDLAGRGTSLSVEIGGGVTTFLTMSYIIFVQPIILSACGMDAGAVMAATCIASALGTLAMAFFTNYPIALAPAMGHNLFFAFTVCGIMGYTWQVALAANLVAGILFVILALLGVQTALLAAVSSSLKNAIAVGIGLMIAFLGIQWSGIIRDDPAVLVGLGDLGSPPVLLSLTGLVIISVLMVLRVKAAFIIAMIATTLIGWAITHFTEGSENSIAMITYQGIMELKVPDLSPTFFKLDLLSLKDLGFFSALTVILLFLFLDIFDTMGTLIGVGEQAGYVKDGTIPKAKGAFLADSVGTVAGTLLGTSTVTSYVESTAGVAAGARTGIANIVTAALFLLALFFSPLVRMISGGYPMEDGRTLYPILAPVLMMVGFLMMRNVIRIAWEDLTEGLPAFLCISLMMYTFSITEGIAMGFIATSALKLFSGRFKETSWVIHVMSILFLLRWIFMETG